MPIMPTLTILSENSGQHVEMLEDGTVRATGDPNSLNSQWFIRAHERVFRFENAKYLNHYLVIAKNGNRVSLLSQYLNEPPTEGSTAEATMCNTTTQLNASSASGDQPTASGHGASGSGTEPICFYADWIQEQGNRPRTWRLKTFTGDSHCFVAFDRNGYPEADLCSENSSNLLTIRAR